MGRLVRKPKLADAEPQSGAAVSAACFKPLPAQDPPPSAVTGDDYLTRMVKYIPAEIIGCSMLINAILAQAMLAGGGDATMAGFSVTTIAAGALLVGMILTPLFCWYVREEGDAWLVNAIVSTMAFPFWAYLMGAVAFAKFHDGNLAADPDPDLYRGKRSGRARGGHPKLQEQANANPKEGPRLVETSKALEGGYATDCRRQILVSFVVRWRRGKPF